MSKKKTNRNDTEYFQRSRKNREHLERSIAQIESEAVLIDPELKDSLDELVKDVDVDLDKRLQWNPKELLAELERSQEYSELFRDGDDFIGYR